MEQLCSSQPSDTIVLASGDGDFMPVIRKAIEKTFNVEIWSFKSGGKDDFQDMTIIISISTALAKTFWSIRYRIEINYLDEYLTDLR